VAEKLRFILTPILKTFLCHLVEPMGQSPDFLCDTPLPFLTYVSSFVQIVSGLGSYSQKKFLQPSKVIAVIGFVV